MEMWKALDASRYALCNPIQNRVDVNVAVKLLIPERLAEDPQLPLHCWTIESVEQTDIDGHTHRARFMLVAAPGPANPNTVEVPSSEQAREQVHHNYFQQNADQVALWKDIQAKAAVRREKNEKERAAAVAAAAAVAPEPTISQLIKDAVAMARAIFPSASEQDTAEALAQAESDVKLARSVRRSNAEERAYFESVRRDADVPRCWSWRDISDDENVMLGLLMVL